MSGRNILLPEVLPNQLLSAPGSSRSELDFNNEPPPSGKTMDQSGLSTSDKPLLCPQPSHKPEELLHTKPCAALENPMCRICHEGGLQEALVTPCECLGTMATIHRSCLEHWLSASGTSFCELCHFQFSIQRKSRPLLEWLQSPGLRRERRTLLGDLLCFLLITPLATVSGWLCLRGAVDHLHFSSRLEAVGLIALTVALFSIYLFWTLVSLRYHCRLYNDWRLSNQRVVLLLPLPPLHETQLRPLSSSQRGKSLSKESIV